MLTSLKGALKKKWSPPLASMSLRQYCAVIGAAG